MKKKSKSLPPHFRKNSKWNFKPVYNYFYSKWSDLQWMSLDESNIKLSPTFSFFLQHLVMYASPNMSSTITQWFKDKVVSVQIQSPRTRSSNKNGIALQLKHKIISACIILLLSSYIIVLPYFNSIPFPFYANILWCRRCRRCPPRWPSERGLESYWSKANPWGCEVPKGMVLLSSWGRFRHDMIS